MVVLSKCIIVRPEAGRSLDTGLLGDCLVRLGTRKEVLGNLVCWLVGSN